jgi:hypothetical protein
MAEYIERGTFIEAVKDIPMWGSVAAMIADSIPTADVAPVTRCKDCKHSWEDTGGLCCSYGPLVDSIVPEDFFCAYGEPKEAAHADDHD